MLTYLQGSGEGHGGREDSATFLSRKIKSEEGGGDAATRGEGSVPKNRSEYEKWLEIPTRVGTQPQRQSRGMNNEVEQKTARLTDPDWRGGRRR